jgi:hypothetical protein
MPCASNPLPLLLLEPRSRQGILRRSCAGAAHASQTEGDVLSERSWTKARTAEHTDGTLSRGAKGAVLVCSEPAQWTNAPPLKEFRELGRFDGQGGADQPP